MRLCMFRLSQAAVRISTLVFPLLTLGAHAHSEGYSSCRVCMYVCVCDHS